MTAICSKCGRDCRTWLALGKHEAICQKEPEEAYRFYDRHRQKNEKCPICRDIWRDFLVLDEDTWVCLECGCQFMSMERREKVLEWKVKDAEEKRSKSS